MRRQRARVAGQCQYPKTARCRCGPLDGLSAGVAGPGDGEVAGDQPDLARPWPFRRRAGTQPGWFLPSSRPRSQLVTSPPVHRAVLASAQVREQARAELCAPGGDRPAGPAQDLADLVGPVPPAGVPGMDAVEAARDVRAALPHPGEPGIGPGRFQPPGQPLIRAGGGPRRDRRAQQRPPQHRRPPGRHIAPVINHDGGGVRSAGHRPGPPARRAGRGDRPASAAAHLRHQPAHLLQPHRRDLPHQPPSPARRPGAGQPRPARPAPGRRISLPGPARLTRRFQPGPPGGPAAHRARARATAPAAPPAAPPSGAPAAASGSLDGRQEELPPSTPRRRPSPATRNPSRRITSARRACPAPSAARSAAISVSLASATARSPALAAPTAATTSRTADGSPGTRHHRSQHAARDQVDTPGRLNTRQLHPYGQAEAAPEWTRRGFKFLPLGGDRQNPRRLRRSRFGAAAGISCSRMPARSSVADVLGH
jgi:hypothetical protein